MIFDPSVLSIEDVLGQYFSRARGSGSTIGQYRSQIFPISDQQAVTIESLANGSGVPLATPGSAESTFWSAEAYHQKYRLRRNAGVVSAMTERYGSRWDEHVFATKLNAVGERGFDIEPWLAEMPTAIADAFKSGG